MSQNTSNNTNLDTDSDGSAPQLPSGSSFGSDLGARSLGRANWGVPTQVAVLALLLIVSLAAILAMRHFGTRTANADTIKPAKVDYSFDGLSPAAAAEQQRIVGDLKRGVTPKANEYGRLPRNPFSLTESDIESTPMSQDDSLERAERERSERDQALRAEIASVQLQAVMGGSRPIARVNGQFLKVGDKIGEHLVIAAIHGRSIEVNADGQTYVIEMGDAEKR